MTIKEQNLGNGCLLLLQLGLLDLWQECCWQPTSIPSFLILFHLLAQPLSLLKWSSRARLEQGRQGSTVLLPKKKGVFSALEVGEDVNSSPTSKIKGGRVCFTRFLFWPGLLSNARVHGGQDEAAAEIADSPCFMGGLVLQLPTDSSYSWPCYCP